MKTYFTFIAIILLAIILIIGIPLTMAALVNSQTDVGILTLIVLVSVISGTIAKISYNFYKKGSKSNG